MDQLRKQYTQEDEELIREVLEARANSSQKSEPPAPSQKIVIEEALVGKLMPNMLA